MKRSWIHALLIVGALLLLLSLTTSVPHRRVIAPVPPASNTLPSAELPDVNRQSSKPVIERDDDSPNALLDRVRAALASGDPAEHDLVFMHLLPALVGKDPRAVARFAEVLEPRMVREEFMQRLTQLWAERDAAAAEGWAVQLSDTDERNSVLGGICLQVAQADAHQALLTAEKYELGKPPGSIVENLEQQWAQQDFSSALAWAKDQPASGHRDQLMMRLALVEAQAAPNEAARLVLEQIPQGPVQTEAAMMVLHQWARGDMEGAEAWVKLFPEGALRDRAEGELAGIRQYSSN
jgi:hypothetical protein